ncbi:MAG: GDYXXLXY domain-containing protein [Elusimicrobiales bacterium]
MSRYRLFLCAQILVFAVWGAKLLSGHTNSAVVWLDTRPVDPRDLLSGHYIALSYPAADLRGLNCGPQPDIFVKLEPDSVPVQTMQGPVLLYHAAACSAEKSGGGIWVRAMQNGGNAVYGIERFYLNENNPIRFAKSGNLAAKVLVNSGGDMRITAVAEKNQ